MSALKPGSVIGILGGGQLGRMLAMAAARLGYRTAVLEPDPNCPAAQVANHHIRTAYDDADGLAELARMCDVITYEFENVPVEAARTLSEGRPLFPPPLALEVSQDRLTEKTFLNGEGIATAPFVPVNSMNDLRLGLSTFRNQGVLKTRRLGYDGKGQRVLRDASPEEAEKAYAELSGHPLILEGFVPFVREISVIAARSQDGAVVSYDPAENVHRNGILFSSTVPAAITAETQEEAKAIAGRILHGLNYVGVIGVEFFVLQDGSLLVNEIAPRVHNSGHWTEAACVLSQFELHIRAIAGLPLGDTRRHSDCVMENLLGEDQNRAPELLQEPNLVLHLYGKAEPRPGRKMGHFTRLIRRAL